jgi:hypothetical protein
VQQNAAALVGHDVDAGELLSPMLLVARVSRMTELADIT